MLCSSCDYRGTRDLPESSKRTFGSSEKPLIVANEVILEEYLRALNGFLEQSTTVVVVRRSPKELGSLFGGGHIDPIEVVTDGTITETGHFGTNLEIPGATYTGWTAGRRWDQAPFDYFINTTLSPDYLRGLARSLQATKLSLAINRGNPSRAGIKLREPVTYPFR